MLVYDLEHDVGHCLNSTAAATWRLCDGSNSPSQIAGTLSRQLSVEVDESVVLLALDQLGDAHLLVVPEVPPDRPSRRVAIGRMGIAAAMALPLVTSVVAPTPAQAASCLHGGSLCSSNSQCCSNVCDQLITH